jgi:hypothetical protein
VWQVVLRPCIKARVAMCRPSVDMHLCKTVDSVFTGTRMNGSEFFFLVSFCERLIQMNLFRCN